MTAVDPSDSDPRHRVGTRQACAYGGEQVGRGVAESVITTQNVAFSARAVEWPNSKDDHIQEKTREIINTAHRLLV